MKLVDAEGVERVSNPDGAIIVEMFVMTPKGPAKQSWLQPIEHNESPAKAMARALRKAAKVFGDVPWDPMAQVAKAS